MLLQKKVVNHTVIWGSQNTAAMELRYLKGTTYLIVIAFKKSEHTEHNRSPHFKLLLDSIMYS